jgi:hypothetical protein
MLTPLIPCPEELVILPEIVIVGAVMVTFKEPYLLAGSGEQPEQEAWIVPLVLKTFHCIVTVVLLEERIVPPLTNQLVWVQLAPMTE